MSEIKFVEYSSPSDGLHEVMQEVKQEIESMFFIPANILNTEKEVEIINRFQLMDIE